MKTLAFVVGCGIAIFGAVGIVTPSSLASVAQRFLTPSAFYLVATARIAFGLILISVAASSRMPRALRILGSIIVVAGIATALMGLVGMGRARDIIDRWVELGPTVVRLTGGMVMVLGSFVAYACAPDALLSQRSGLPGAKG